MKNISLIILMILAIACKNQKSEKELYTEAESLFNSEQDSLCIINLNKLIQKYTSNSEAIYLRAFSKHRSGKLNEAIEDYSKHIELKPDFAEAWYFRGVLKYQLNDSTALSDYNKAIELNPNFGEAFNNRAIIYIVKNEKEKACSDLKSAQKLGISNADSLIIKYCNSN